MVTGQGRGMGIGGCNKLCPAATGHSWVALFPCLCQLRTVRCIGPWSSHRFIIPNTYLLIEAGRLVTLLSWAPALSGPTDWRRG
jgi:hypothetical protein